MNNNLLWRPFTNDFLALEAIKITNAKMSKIYDAEGKSYIDAIASWWVNIHGHCHPAITSAIATQAGLIDHTVCADFSSPSTEELLDILHQITDRSFNKFFFSDNGSTSVEVAIKASYQYWKNQSMEKTIFATFSGDYHGDTIGAMSVSPSEITDQKFKSLMFPVSHLPFPATWIEDDNLEQKEAQAMAIISDFFAENHSKIIAFIVEPLVQGASGMKIIRPEFLQKCLTIARSYGIIIIFDEVMTGFGRTGKMFAYNHLQNFVPDILCLSKGISGGFLPLGVTAFNAKIYAAFAEDQLGTKTFLHGHSYTANPIICAAAVASLKLLLKTNLQEVKAIEKYYQKISSKPSPYLEKTRYLGGIFACEINMQQIDILAIYKNLCNQYIGHSSALLKLSEAAEIKRNIGSIVKYLLLKKGVYLRPLGTILYIIPPYCISSEELDTIFHAINEVLFLKSRP